jgi:hypothetical protein
MKNYYKDKYPNAWKEWKEYSEMEYIDFKTLYEWSMTHGMFIQIVQFPDQYTAQMEIGNLFRVVGIYEEWFEALDAMAEEVMRIVEDEYKDKITELIDLSRVSKLLDIDVTSKEGVLIHYRNLIVEIGETTKLMLKDVTEAKELAQEDVDRLDTIIMLALACKRLIL